ncbi:internal virion protein B [Escherichia coli]|nr:internal virion protein B [Escherichia coli]MCY4679386.1 internal virion protein B [Escherichia coli]MCY4689424.1 internal virion protein B [Escherichia coli]MCY4705009.1 internal virion protein B [Escherichia coli]MCY4709356.1 internal virion protein B [Escherichia coli]MCY4713647.1 internal virion protein B [Escherichia coli]
MIMGGMQGEQAKAAQIDQGRRQSWQMVKEMNYNDANLKLESRDLIDSTVQEMTQANMNRVRNMGTIRAAIGEGMLEGNSMDRVQRVTEGDFLRESQGLTENYQRDYSVILGKRLANHENTVSQIKEINNSEPRLKGKLEQIIDPLGLGLTKLVDVATAGSPLTNKLGKKAAAKVKASDAKSTGQGK